jgi:hypothetical protein
MAVYSIKDFTEKKGGGAKVRKLELEEGKQRKIWIPEFKFLYKRVHFMIQKLTDYKNAKFSAMDCFNNNLGEKGKGCPLCKCYDELWDKWRAATKKEDKQALLGMINRLMTEEYWFNAVDIGDPELPFLAARFTASKMKELASIDAEYGIDNVILLYKMKKEGIKTTYTLQEDADRAEVVKNLKDQYDTLSGREYTDGGPVDLDRGLLRNQTMEVYMNRLMGGHDHEESSEENAIEEESTSLTDITLEDVPAKEKKSVEKDKKLSLEDDKLDLSDLDKDDDVSLELDLDDVVEKLPEKQYAISPLFIKQNAKVVKTIESIFEHLNSKKELPSKETYKEKIEALFGYVKTKKEIKVPMSVMVGEYTEVVNL